MGSGTDTAEEMLRRALASGDEIRLLDAMMLIAWMRGLERIAADAGLESSTLFLALSDGQHPDMAVVRQVAERLTAGIPQNGKT